MQSPSSSKNNDKAEEISPLRFQNNNMRGDSLPGEVLNSQNQLIHSRLSSHSFDSHTRKLPDELVLKAKTIDESAGGGSKNNKILIESDEDESIPQEYQSSKLYSSASQINDNSINKMGVAIEVKNAENPIVKRYLSNEILIEEVTQ